MSSLSAMAMRFCATRILSGATYADDRVFDSAIAQVDQMVVGQDNPFITIYTEDEDLRPNLREINSTGEGGTIDLVIEVAVMSIVEAQDGEGGPSIVIPSTDGGIELTLSLMTRQIKRALFESRTPWGMLFKRFCIGVDRQMNRRAAQNKDGARFAARQLVFSIRPLFDPPFGHVPQAGEPWGDLLALMEADSELSSIAALVRQAITGTPIPEWDRPRSDMGLTPEAARGIGVASVSGDEAPPPAVEGTVADAE
jgi:hypothetical protein